MKRLDSEYSERKVGLLILDLDGTLADTIESIREGVNLAMERYGYPTRSYEQVRLAIGNGAGELIRLSMPEEAARDPRQVSRVLADYHEIYGTTYSHCSTCYAGMKEALLTLRERGYTLAVLSNKQDAYVKALVSRLLPPGLIAYAEGQTERPKKPDPTVPLWMAAHLGFSPAETAFVGDSEVDVATARNAGMMAVGCAWGYRGTEVLREAGAHVILDAPAELCDCFGAIESKIE